MSKPNPETAALDQDREGGSAAVPTLGGALQSMANLEREMLERKKVEVQEVRARGRLMTPFKEDMRAISSDLARSPLFAPIGKGERRHVDSALPSPDGVAIRYSGKQLDQGDCDVFMQLIHEAGGQTVGTNHALMVRGASLLKQTGRSVGGDNYKWLRASLSRLRDGKLTIENERFRIETALILKVSTDKDEVAFQIVFDPDIVTLFTGNEYTLVDWSKRKMLCRRRELAKWLHNFICSHKRGLQRWQISTLQSYSGYRSPIRKFREALLEALSELERVGVLADPKFYEQNTKVSWVRPL